MREIVRTGLRLGKPYEIVFKVDDDVYDKVKDLTQCVRWSGQNAYLDIKVLPGQNKGWVKLHRLIMGLGYAPGFKSDTVDHIDRDTTNNQRSNLRLATQQEQCFNRTKHRHWRGRPTSSRHKGVVWNGGYWRAYIQGPTGRINLGTYATEDEAGMAYNLKAVEIFGGLAALNDVPSGIIPKPRSRHDRIKKSCRNASGVPQSSHVGVVRKGNRWGARHKGKYIGWFATEEEASRTYWEASH